MAQFSMELRELEAVRALGTLSQIAETELDTPAIIVCRFGGHFS